MHLPRILLAPCLVLAAAAVSADGEAGTVSSLHLGFLYPSGVDVVGYTAESGRNANVYTYYTFGFPALAAAGVNYYGNHAGSGVTATLGVGLGSVMYASLAYQWRITRSDYLKLGAGLTTGIAYTGGYPVLSFEHHY